MDSTKTNIVRNVTFFISFVTSSLFAIGYLHESVFLERFGFNDSELAPDIATAITFGFRFLFLNVYSVIVSILIYGLATLVLIESIKKDITSTVQDIKWLEAFTKFVDRLLSHNPNPLLFSGGIVLLFCLTLLVVLMIGKEHADTRKDKSNPIECLQYTNGNEIITLEGQLVRIRDGLVAFWVPSNANGKSYIIPERKIFELSYSACKQAQSND